MKLKIILYSVVFSLIFLHANAQSNSIKEAINHINDLTKKEGMDLDRKVSVRITKNGILTFKVPKGYNYPKYLDLTAISAIDELHTKYYVHYGIGGNISYLPWEQVISDPFYTVELLDDKDGYSFLQFRKKEVAIMVCKEFEYIQNFLIKGKRK